MDLNLLYAFSAIYRERNLTKASECLGMSPAGVSAALRRLRIEFQDSLFIRKAHGVEPTMQADAIAKKLGLALELLEQVKNPDRAFDPASEKRTFVIGMSDYSEALILPSLLKVLNKSAPGIDLTIRHTGNVDIRKSLVDGIFDLLIGNVMRPLGRIRQQQLLVEYMVGLVAKTHPLASRAFTIHELNEYPALLPEGHGNNRWWNENPAVKLSGYAPSKVISVPDFMIAPLILLDSSLVCATARRLSLVFTKDYPLQTIPLPFDDTPILIKQYWHERWHTNPAHSWLRQSIYTVCEALN